VITPAPAAASAAAISPGGAEAAIGSQTGQVSFVETSTGRARNAAGSASGPVESLTYSPGGNTVASTGNDNRVILWRPEAATAGEVLTAPAEQVQYVAFSPNGRTLYTSSLGGVLLAWDLSGERSFGRRFGFASGVPCCEGIEPLAPTIAVSPDGTKFAVPLDRSTVGLFSTRTLTEEAAFKVGSNGMVITALAWAPTAPTLAVAGHSGLVQLWDVQGSPRLMRSLTGLQPQAGLPEAVQALAFSPDGHLLAATDSSVTIEPAGPGEGLVHVGNHLAVLAIWRASSGRLVRATRDLGTGKGRYGALAFSRDGRLLAVSQPDGSDEVLELKSGRLRRTLYPLGSDDTVSMTFGANGTLATGTQGGIVQLWNTSTGKQVADPVAVAAGPVTSLVFDPGGQRFVTTGGPDGAVKLWAASTLQQEGSALAAEPRTAMRAAFEPGGAALIVINDRGAGFIWPTSLPSWEQRACAIAGRNLTAKEWSFYLPGQPYERVCP
jgi:WD40 repeat protein